MAIVRELDVLTQTRVIISNETLKNWHVYMGRGGDEQLSAVTMLKKREGGLLELFSTNCLVCTSGAHCYMVKSVACRVSIKHCSKLPPLQTSHH